MDYGSSCGNSPCRDDSPSNAPTFAPIKDFSGINKEAGECFLIWKLLDVFCHSHVIRIKGYHISQASLHLLSSQTIFKSIGGSGFQDIVCYSYFLPGNHFQSPLWSYKPSHPSYGISLFWSNLIFGVTDSIQMFGVGTFFLYSMKTESFA